MKIDYKALTKIGREWHKADMHRFYIDLYAASEFYRNNNENLEWGDIPCNRREKDGGKVWIDMETGEISTKGIRDGEGMVNALCELIAIICPEETETQEEVETQEETEAQETCENEQPINAIWYAVMVDRDDSDWGTGSFDLAEATKRVLRYRAEGNVDAYIAVIDDSTDAPFCIDEIHEFEEAE